MKDYLSKPEINFFMSILVPLIAIGIAWGVMTTRINHVEAIAIALQNEYSVQRQTNEDIKVKLAEIQKDILYIRTELDKHSLGK